MIVTFLIGNGFDLNLGMRTSYSDVYKEYMKTPSKSDSIAKLKQDLDKNYKNWADFEMGMADYAARELTEDQLVECVRDFRNFLIDYLDQEQQHWLGYFSERDTLDEHCEEMCRSYREFYYDLIPNERLYIERYLSNPHRPIIDFRTISFNYTILLDYFIETNSKNAEINVCHPVLHPHGKGADGIALGIDNEHQTALPLSRKGKRAFVKPYFNQDYDSKRVDDAIEVIEKSDIICIYGLSLGDSDQAWRDALAQWLQEDPNGRIVWYAYEVADVNTKNKDEILDEEERLKHIFLSKLGLDNDFDEYENQIYIPIKRTIFRFPTIYDILNNRLNKSKELVAK